MHITGFPFLRHFRSWIVNQYFDYILPKNEWINERPSASQVIPTYRFFLNTHYENLFTEAQAFLV